MNIGIVSTIKRGREKGDVDYQDTTNQEDSRSSITSVHDSLHLHLRSETVFMLLVAIFMVDMVICYVDVLVDIMVDIFHVGAQHVATLLPGMHLLQNFSSKEARPAQEQRIVCPF